jgi:hypothetical protein
MGDSYSEPGRNVNSVREPGVWATIAPTIKPLKVAIIECRRRQRRGIALLVELELGVEFSATIYRETRMISLLMGDS